MINIGINGLGRIGKSIFIQLIEDKEINVCVINIPGLDITNIETYLKNDSTHNYNNNFDFEIVNDSMFKINGKIIKTLHTRDAKLLNWRKYGIDYLIDATGVYLTYEKIKEHDVDYVIVSAPSKDNVPEFVMYGNNDKYNGEKYVSNASCTTNCIVPVLNCLDKEFHIEKCNFITVHATTSSQNTIDTNHFKNRTHRSILNNIIPHTTGASKSVIKILPQLEGKISGTSVRVPVVNVSMIDLNVILKNKTSLEDILNLFNNTPYIRVNYDKYLVSTDFNTTTCSSIIDKNACIDMGDNHYKLSIWYDNEWSYSNRLIELVKHMYKYNKINDKPHPYFIENFDYTGQNVVLRVDWNVPIKDEKIQDFFRIKSSLKTINYLLERANKVIIISHLGRPARYNEEYSMKKYLNQIQKYFTTDIEFLPKGLSEESLSTIKSSNSKLFLLENIRFHEEETNRLINTQVNDIYNKLGDFYVNDAFGTCHRDHLSVTGFKGKNKSFGYLINKEIQSLKIILNNNSSDKVLAIVGGGKMDDKLPLLNSLSKKVDGIYIAGGNINSIRQNSNYKNYIDSLKNNKAEIYLMKDGLASDNVNNYPSYFSINNCDSKNNFYDIGMQSIIELEKLIDKYDIIFWNGPLGIIENDLYSCGSITLFNMLEKSKKKIIIGGGDTACFVNKYNHNFYYVSTGGGATLDYISNGYLIGIEIFN